MLNDLSFLDVGEQWPPPSERERLELYRTNRRLFDSKADEVYGRWVTLLGKTGALEETHYALNFHKRLSMLWADLVVGEPPQYAVSEPESQEQDALRAIVEQNGFDSVMHEVLVDASRYGDGVFRLRIEDGGVVIEGQSPEFWFPVVHRANVRRMLYHVLVWTFEHQSSEAGALSPSAAPSAGAGGVARTRFPTFLSGALGGARGALARHYVQVEIHSAGMVEHRLHELKDGVIGRAVSDPAAIVENWPGELETTRLDAPLVFHAPGARTTDRLHGIDDYTSIDSSMEYLMWLMAGRQGVIVKHQDPSIAGPPGETRRLQSGEEVYEGGSRYFEVDEDARIVPQYITWDGKLDPSFRQTEKLWEDVYIQSETSPTAFGHSESGYAESGTSLRLRMVASLKKSERIRQRFDPVVKRVLRAAGELASVDLSDLSITWHDGLPSDEREASEISERDVATSITSRRNEMKRRYGYTDDQAEEEMARIDEEKPQSPPSVAEQILGTVRPQGSSSEARQSPKRPMSSDEPLATTRKPRDRSQQ